MKLSFLQLILLLLLFSIFFLQQPKFSNKIITFISTFLETIKKRDSFRK